MSVLVVAQSSSEIPEGLMNNPVFNENLHTLFSKVFLEDYSQIYSELRYSLVPLWKNVRGFGDNRRKKGQVKLT